MAIEKIISVEFDETDMSSNNMDKVIDSDKVAMDTVINLDPGTAAAYQDSVAFAENKANVESELEERAQEIVSDSPETTETPVKNMYTEKLVLDESLEDFDRNDSIRTRENDDEDRYIEFDMFDFIYNLFSSETDSLIRPLKALSRSTGRGRKKAGDSSAFMYQGSDNYESEIDDGAIQGIPQISTDGDGNVVLYQDDVEKFNPAIDLCKEYGLSYTEPEAKRAPWLRWNFSMTVVVPTYDDGYPMEVEDYFEKQGIAIEDVMPTSYIVGRNRDSKKIDDETAVEVAFSKYVKIAANNSDPLDGYVKSMFAELDAQGVKYDKSSLKKRFFDEFEDDFED